MPIALSPLKLGLQADIGVGFIQVIPRGIHKGRQDVRPQLSFRDPLPAFQSLSEST